MMLEQARRRKNGSRKVPQRPVLACTECARRKQRCSKTIPCSACIDRGMGPACRREHVDMFQHRSPTPHRRTRAPPENDDDHGNSDGERAPNSSPGMLGRSSNHQAPSNGAPQVPSTSSPPTPSARDSMKSSLRAPPNDSLGLTNETVSMLEFLAHGRRNILHSRKAPQGPVIAESALQHALSPSLVASDTPAWDTVLSVDEARLLLLYHRDHLAWMHNVVHMPTFMREFEISISQPPEDCWMALYYAILSTTLYHTNEEDIMDLGALSTETIHSAFSLHDRSIQCLYNGKFTSKHTIYSAQTVCVLLQVAHNFDQSDMISVLVATAIKICQCLNVHRLGPDRPAPTSHLGDEAVSQALVEREVKKRVWWFLIRQDWLQIPFQNTYTVHPSQFNTPMPLNCLDDPALMIADGEIVVQGPDVYTQNSYSTSLNSIAVIIWKHHNHMVEVGHPGASPDGILRLYDQVIWADKEIKKAFAALPSFLRITPDPEATDQPHAGRQASLALLSMAHKILTVHRHFQLASFQDRRFAFTQLSCLSIAERVVIDVQAWPEDLASNIASRMWTSVTHLLTCCVILVFASIFRAENDLLYDGAKMRYLAETGRQSIRRTEAASSIARRGGRMLDALLDLDQTIRQDPDVKFDMGSIIARVASVEEFADSNFAADKTTALPFDFASWDDMFGGVGDGEVFC